MGNFRPLSPEKSPEQSVSFQKFPHYDHALGEYDHQTLGPRFTEYGLSAKRHGISAVEPAQLQPQAKAGLNWRNVA